MNIYKCNTVAKAKDGGEIRLEYTYFASSFKQATDWVKQAMMDSETLVSVVRKDGKSQVEEQSA
jgi:hypothetical protein